MQIMQYAVSILTVTNILFNLWSIYAIRAQVEVQYSVIYIPNAFRVYALRIYVYCVYNVVA